MIYRNRSERPRRAPFTALRLDLPIFFFSKSASSDALERKGCASTPKRSLPEPRATNSYTPTSSRSRSPTLSPTFPVSTPKHRRSRKKLDVRRREETRREPPRNAPRPRQRSRDDKRKSFENALNSARPAREPRRRRAAIRKYPSRNRAASSAGFKSLSNRRCRVPLYRE